MVLVVKTLIPPTLHCAASCPHTSRPSNPTSTTTSCPCALICGRNCFSFPSWRACSTSIFITLQVGPSPPHWTWGCASSTSQLCCKLPRHTTLANRPTKVVTRAHRSVPFSRARSTASQIACGGLNSLVARLACGCKSRRSWRVGAHLAPGSLSRINGTVSQPQAFGTSTLWAWR